jgi:RND superfamily putative drug exporter
MNQLREKMTAIDAVSNVGQPVWAENGKAALLPINLKGTPDDGRVVAIDGVDPWLVVDPDERLVQPVSTFGGLRSTA